MLTKKSLPALIVLICCIELLIYLWSAWTTTFDGDNFYAIQQEFVFDKCARLAGRISSLIMLFLLLMIGRYGLKKIYAQRKQKEQFLTLITLFTVNHMVHLLFVMLRFDHHSEPLSILENLHGFVTFIFIVAVPLILWIAPHLTRFLYIVTILHLLNICFFIAETFWSKVEYPDHPAYHNQLGIVVIIAACFYVLYRVYVETRTRLFGPNNRH